MSRVFALSSDARALLFCRGAVIFSGETELGALPVWFGKSKKAEDCGAPSDLDIGFYSVAGDGGFSNMLSVLHAFDIPWTVVCDGKSFDVAENWAAHIFRQIQRAGIGIDELNDFTRRVNEAGKPQRSMTTELWDEQIELGRHHGVLTLATSWRAPGEAIEAFFERVAPGKLTEAEAEVGSGSKIRKGRWLAEETSCPVEIEEMYEQVLMALLAEELRPAATPGGQSI
jgi:hypothetical protein